MDGKKNKKKKKERNFLGRVFGWEGEGEEIVRTYVNHVRNICQCRIS